MRTLLTAIVIVGALFTAPGAFAHAFPTTSSPRAGATLTTTPQQVEVWFDGEIEPVFSTLVVKNSAGKQVSLKKGKVDGENHKLLRTSLPRSLAAGQYTAHWSVAGHDGHRTAGSFDFTVK